MTIQLNPATLTAILQKLLAQRLLRYGRLTGVRYDAPTRSLRLEIVPVGETQLFWVELVGCHLVCKGTTHTLRSESIRASREWLERLLCDHRDRLEVPVPPAFLGVVQTILKER